MGSVLHRASGSASVDIEPQTLVWLLERDPSAYRATIAAYDSGTAGFVMTPPFHPILPHLHRQEREALFDLMFDFYSPLIERAEGRPIGLWLPEAAYSHETMDSFRESAQRGSVACDPIGDSIQSTYLVADARQFAHPPELGEAWARVNSTERLLAIARDHPLSGDFAFGATTGSEFVASVRSRGNGSLFVANDLESLLANPMQAERFESIVHSLREGGVQVVPPVPPRDAPTLALVDHSSWSDYDDMHSGGINSETRSDPRFWDNPDTRVTFQNVVLLVQALRDLAEASVRAKDLGHAAGLGRLLRATFLEFLDWHARGEFAALQTVPAWETTEAAWYSSLESEVSERSPADVIKRATMFALAPSGEWPGGDPVLSVEETVADTGHIVGEAHGEWKNPRWCEHGPG